MELINQILQTIINSFDVAYCLVVNFLTYILISSIISVIHKQITRVWKRVILCISIVIVSIAYVNFGNIDIRVLINSIILAPISLPDTNPISKIVKFTLNDNTKISTILMGKIISCNIAVNKLVGPLPIPWKYPLHILPIG